MPHAIRRPILIAHNVLADRERPDLDVLARIEDPERFVWAILPHAARTFSASIALLPARSALPAAVAYLYCRMLDTYEDLVVDAAAQDAALRCFAERFAASDSTRPGADGELSPAPAIGTAAARDDRDRAHLLLVARAALVDRVYASFDAPVRAVIARLVNDMAAGMRWSARRFAAQGGVLIDDAQLLAYCGHVLGTAVVAAAGLLRVAHGAAATLSAAEHAHAMRVGELIQLANITRDIEKDLVRGVAYDPSLRPYLGRDVRGDADAEACVRAVRERLLRTALARAPSYRPLIDALRLPRVSLARGSALVMLLFTEQYYRGCARRVGLRDWPGPDSAGAIFRHGVLAAASRRRAFREVARVTAAFGALAADGT